MSTTADEALASLTTALGAAPPDSTAELDPTVLTRLADAVHAEHARQDQAIGAAVDDALRLVPRPLRGIVKRIIIP